MSRVDGTGSRAVLDPVGPGEAGSAGGRRLGIGDRSLLAALVLFGLFVGLWPLLLSLEPTVDDGFYYLEIARNLAHGLGSTFDGRHPTNGYHPLWLLVLVPVHWLTADPSAALRLAQLLQALLAAASVILVYRSARTALGPLAATLATLAWIDLTYRFWLSGLELALHTLCLLVVIQLYLTQYRARAPGPRAALALGVACAATFLSRVDALLLVPVLAPAVLGSPGSRRSHGWAFAAPVAGAAAVYAAVNLAIFGHLGPVSAAVKRDWSRTLAQLDPVTAEHGWVVAKGLNLARPILDSPTSGEARPLALGLAAVAAWGVARLLARRGLGWAPGFLQRGRLLAPWVGYTLVQLGAYGLYYHGSQSYRPWYYVAAPWLGAVTAASIAEGWARGPTAPRGRYRDAILALLCVLLAAHTVRGLLIWKERHRPSPFAEAAAWADDQLPPEAVVGAWNAGTLGYGSSHPVVNLDGLVNSWPYFEHRRHDLCRYWQEASVTHLIDAYRDGQFLTLLPTQPSYEGCMDRLELLRNQPLPGEDWSVRVYRIQEPITTVRPNAGRPGSEP